MSRIGRQLHGPDRHRLDSALVTAGQSADAATRAQIAAFESILRQSRRGKAAGRRSLREEIEHLTMPEVADPGIFSAGRMSAILGHVIAEILPGLDMPQDVLDITESMLREEIESQRDIQDRIEDRIDEDSPA